MIRKMPATEDTPSAKRLGGRPARQRGSSGTGFPLAFERLEDRRLLSASTLINEIDVNDPSKTDNRYMYVELEGTPGASLNNLYFVAFQSGGNAELVQSLSGFSIGADGLAVIKNTTGGFSIPAATTVIPNNTFFGSSGSSGFTQDTLSFYLFSSPTALVQGTDYDSNNDGVLDHLPTGATALDHVAVLTTGSGDLTYGGVIIQDNNSGATSDAVTRFFGATTTTQASWFGGELDDTGNQPSQTLYDVTRPGTNMPNGAFLTPGMVNYPVPAGPTLTPSVSSTTFTAGSGAIAIDSGITLSDPESTAISSATITTTGLTEDAYGFATPPTMSETITQGHTGQGTVNVITLTGLDSVANYQAALRSITYQDTASSSVTPGTRTLSYTINDGITTTSATETVKVAIPAPVVTASGTVAKYTAGAPAVVVDAGFTVSSFDAALTGATVTISPGTLAAGDTLSFTSPVGSGINILSNTGGVLTLTGTATLAQYQTALRSVTFSSTSASTTTRAISIVALDAKDSGSPNSNAAPEQISVQAPATVTAVYLSSSAWVSTFNSYLATQGLGTAAQGYALKSGAAELTAPLPWVNLDTISIQFSQPVNVAGGITVAQGSLELLGGSGSGITAPPAIASFSVSGNVATWVLAGPLTNNQYVIGLASTGSEFGTPVTDANGAGLDGEFTKSVTTLPSGNGVAGGTFDFWFNVLPGDQNQTGTVDAADTNDVAALLGKTTRSSGYSVFADLDGSSTINAADLNDASANLGRLLGRGAPSTPAIVQAGETGFTALALAVQETGGAQVVGTQVAGILPTGTQATGSPTTSSATSVVSITTPASAAPAGSDSDGSDSANDAETSSTTLAANEATDAALSAFELADLYV